MVATMLRTPPAEFCPTLSCLTFGVHSTVRNKTWIYEERTGYIRNATRPDKCIQRKDNNFDNGNLLELEDCDQGDAEDRERRTWLFE